MDVTKPKQDLVDQKLQDALAKPDYNFDSIEFHTRNV